MIINHNLSSLNTYNKLNTNNTNSSKSLEKLSSGLRINKAGDDAAGLSISEKMRAQIRGLDQATANSSDGISLIQTAEGGLSETHSILQRMRELAVQSATDTNTNDDRSKIQSEVDQLAKEITRISNTTEFNTQNLLAGGLQDTFHIGANAGQNISMSINAMDAQSLGVAGAQKSMNSFTGGAAGVTSASNASRGMAAGTYTIAVISSAASTTSAGVDSVGIAGNTSMLVVGNSASYTGTSDKVYTVKVDTVSGAATGNTVTSIKYSTDGGTSWSSYTGTMESAPTIDGMTFDMDASVDKAYSVGDQYSFTATAAKATFTLKSGTVNIGATQTAHIGDTKITLGNGDTGTTLDVGFAFGSLKTGSATVNVADTKSLAAVVSDGQVNSQATAAVGINVSDQASANNAITIIDNAIKTVSGERSKLGAYQNRLEHTIANLGTSSENMTAAESRIRDVDMAKEMMSFQKNQILSQAATSMLAQANQQPQNVLKLLG